MPLLHPQYSEPAAPGAYREDARPASMGDWSTLSAHDGMASPNIHGGDRSTAAWMPA